MKILILLVVPTCALLQLGCAHHRNHDNPPPQNYYQQPPANYCVPQAQVQPCMPVQGASYSPNTQGNWAQPRANCACP